MDDLVLPMLIPEEMLERPNSSQPKPENSRNDDAPIPPQDLLQKWQEPSEQADAVEDKGSNVNPTI